MAKLSMFAAAAAAAMLLIASSAAGAESGVASVYPQSYKGRRTASGAPFNPGAMTCAHKRHPFGATLRVAIGEKSITCRVTDRGPFTRGRIIDLTPVAAHALGFSGLARVSVERM